MQTQNAPSRALKPPSPGTGSAYTGPLALRGDESDLYRAHQRRLLACVRRAIGADEALIEDACQFAWLQLCRCQPERGERLRGWLRAVAVHEAYRLARLEARRRVPAKERAEAHTRTLDGAPLDMDDYVGPADVDRTVRAREALRALARLPERQREYMELRVAGHSYEEIGRLTGRTYTNVNKHLTRARAALREAA